PQTRTLTTWSAARTSPRSYSTWRQPTSAACPRSRRGRRRRRSSSSSSSSSPGSCCRRCRSCLSS
ncbi:hypothetical protein MNEG_15721, partial [Monoraphidium neglectum]